MTKNERLFRELWKALSDPNLYSRGDAREVPVVKIKIVVAHELGICGSDAYSMEACPACTEAIERFFRAKGYEEEELSCAFCPLDWGMKHADYPCECAGSLYNRWRTTSDPTQQANLAKQISEMKWSARRRNDNKKESSKN
jgi:hypothetical protein